MTKLTYERCLARYEAFTECVGHLQSSWTDDPIEMEESEFVMKYLDRQADYWLNKANEIKEN